MDAHRLLAVALVLALAGCTGGRPSAGRVSVSPGSSRSGGGRSSPARATVANPPPSRMFAGSESAEGILTRSCDRSDCVDLAPRTPAFLDAPGIGPVTFAISETPTQAGLEIRPVGATGVARATLNPGALMAWGPSLAPGRYLVTLTVRWPASEASWLFGLVVG